MLSRRHFLQSATTGATFAALSRGAAAEESTSDCKPLPAAIAKLTSLKELAEPTTKQERSERQEKARQLMRANGIDAILVAAGASLRYFTGIEWWESERLMAMALPAKGKPFFVCPAFEHDRVGEQLASSPQAGSADIRVWQENESPYRLIAEGLHDAGISTGTLGMEENVRFVFSDGVARAAPQVKIVSATPVTAGCRAIKSPHELALMRLACKATITVYEAVYKSLHEGMSAAEVQRLVAQAYEKVGFPGDVTVSIAATSSSPHGSRVQQVIREGSVILLDDGCQVEGYTSDITRTFVLGKPSEKMTRVFEIVHRAQSAALAAARPGATCESVDAAARSVITNAGFGPGYKYFPHRVGHGMGLTIHEWPYLVQGNNMKIEPNMVFSDEPGIYIPGEFGIRLEDDMHITEDGAELLTKQSPSLTDPFGG